MGGIVDCLRVGDIHMSLIWRRGGHGRIRWVQLYLLTKKVLLN